MRPIAVETKVKKSKSKKSEIRSHKTKSEIKTIPKDIYKEFLEVLRPFTDHSITREHPKGWLYVIDENDMDYIKEVADEFGKRVLKLVNKYGLSKRTGYELVRDQHRMVHETRAGFVSPDIFIYYLEHNNLADYLMRYLMEAQCLQDAMNDGGKDEIIEEKLKHQQIFFTYQDGSFVAQANDLLSAVWLSFALEGSGIKPVPCLYCGMPVFHRKSAKFCQPNKSEGRHCSNHYHNALKRERRLARETGSTSGLLYLKDEEERLKRVLEKAQHDYDRFEATIKQIEEVDEAIFGQYKKTKKQKKEKKKK